MNERNEETEPRPGFYRITAGEHTGQIGAVGCSCQLCEKATRNGRVRIRFFDSASAEVGPDECVFVFSEDDASEVIRLFLTGTPLQELPDYAEAAIRESMRQLETFVRLQNTLSRAIQHRIIEAMSPPPQERD